MFFGEGCQVPAVPQIMMRIDHRQPPGSRIRSFSWFASGPGAKPAAPRQRRPLVPGTARYRSASGIHAPPAANQS